MNHKDALGQPIMVGDLLCHTSGGNGCALRHRLVELVGFTPKGRLKVKNHKHPEFEEPSITHNNVVVVTRQLGKEAVH